MTFFYVILSLGINVNLHLCQDKLKAVHLLGGDELCKCSHTCCGNEDGENSEILPCCSHEQHYLKITDFQVLINFDNYCYQILSPAFSFQFEYQPEFAEFPNYSFKPPPRVPLYLKEHRLTYYG
jgi:hypothetical protein